MIDEHALASDVGLTPTFEMSSDFGFSFCMKHSLK